jgi:hypothetical protein
MSIFRDVWATMVTAAGLAVGLSVIQGWNWPVVGDSARWGIVAVGAVSLVACSSSGWATDTARGWKRDPLIVAAIVLGTLTLLVGLAGLVVGTQPYLVWMMAGTVLLWVVSTLRHIWVAIATPSGRLTAA